MLERVASCQTVLNALRELLFQLLAVTSWNELWTEAVGFLPYSSHQFVVTVCNSVGCVNSTLTNGTTAPAGTCSSLNTCFSM